MKSDKNNFLSGFHHEECVQCGKCIATCHYMNLTPQEARTVMTEITGGPRYHDALSSCIRCGKCDYRCPKDARPSDLMRELLAIKRQEDIKTPDSISYAINGMGAEGWSPNFFKDVYRALPQKDKKILKEWAAPKKNKDLLWIGCADRMVPQNIENAHALRHLAKFGGPDDCCGVFAIQSGLFDEGYRTVKRLIHRLEENRFDRLVVACGHCQKMFTKVIPKLGIEFPFPMISIYDYFLELIASGEAIVRFKSTIDAAISDSCFGCENGEDYMGNIRLLAQTIGMNIVELPHNKKDAMCCGYGGLMTNGKVGDVVRCALIKRKDFALSGQKHILNYCPGCHLVNNYFQPGYKSHYLLEEVLKTLGEKLGSPYSVLYRRLLRPHLAYNLMKISTSAF